MYDSDESDEFDFDHDAESVAESADDDNDDDDRSFDESEASASDYDNDDEEEDYDDDEDDENVRPDKKSSAKKSKGGDKSSSVAAAEKKKKKSSSSSAAAARSSPSASKSKQRNEKTIEQTYQKKTQLEHILLRPDTYIGSVEPLAQPMFVLDAETRRIVQREVTYTPGFYKIFDEIVVNAADNKQRDPNMSRMEVDVDAERGVISVMNNGKGIPVAKHKEHGCYVATLIFGHLLTGSNFDDEEEKTTGGRNGYGAKLANIFSRKFTVECVDAAQGLKFTQTWRNNMHEAEDPVVESCSSSEERNGDYVKITFRPDLAKFNMAELDDDAVALISKRAYDIAGSMASREGRRLNVYLNGEKLKVKDFRSYLSLFDGISFPEIYERVGEDWEVGVGSVMDGGGFQQISFVNAIATTKGGGHVDYVTNHVLVKHIQAAVKKKNKGGKKDVKPAQVKNHLAVFINCLVPNPTFDSQTKENLTTKPGTFKKTVALSEGFLKRIEKCGVVESIMQFVKFQEGRALQRKGGTKKNKLKGISKLDDANFAGTSKSENCTLIITEGDSAKSLAVSGLSVVGRDYYGVFPLKGKPLNVRDATHAQIMKNEEIMNLVEIMGLKFKTTYTEENIKSLRYGHLMIMADQDHDGSHIKGLVINFIHHFWPSLLDVTDFLQQFITPIVKCTRGKKAKTFYTLPQFEDWKESTKNNARGWKIKYYKGLGTSTSSEAKEYFSNLGIHEIHFNELSSDIASRSAESGDEMMDIDDEDNEPISGAGLIDMAFNKKKADERKKWLSNVGKNTFLNYSDAQKDGVNYSDFINKELSLFSQYDTARSLPHMLDGLKVSQRKVLYACFKKKLKNEIKVAQLTGYVGEHSAYHHGEASLHGTIVGMAQSYCGSNNINLLYPSGQFGTRRMGGKDHASARYIFTRLEKITRAIFHPDDDDLLTYLNDDGLSIEPEYYMPVIPVVLVNGSDGIGTGWSSNIKSHDPRVIISNIRKMINKEEPEEMHPWFSGWTGEIIAESGKREGSYIVRGNIKRTSNTTLLISELPVGRWTQDYKEKVLEKMMAGADKADEKKKKGEEKEKVEKNESEITDFKENHTDTTVSFTVIATKENIDAFEKEKDGLHGKFKLITTISTKNMTAFDKKGKIRQYKTSVDILTDFFRQRMVFYIARKDMLLHKMRKDLKMLENKARFVEEVCRGDLVVSDRKRSELLGDLKDRGYDLFPKDEDEADGMEDNDESDDDEVMDDVSSDAELAKGYEYLMGMKLWSLTFERAEELRRQRAGKAEEVEKLEATSPEAIWSADLDAIEELLDEQDEAMGMEAKKQKKIKSKSKSRGGSKKASKKKKKKLDVWDSDQEETEPEESDIESDSSEDDFVAAKPAPKAKSAPKKESAKIDEPVAKRKRSNRDLSDDDSEFDAPAPAKSPDKKAKTAAKAKKRQDDWDSELEESEPEESEIESDSSEEDFVTAKPAPKDKKSAPKKSVSTRVNKPMSKQKRANQDMSGDECEGEGDAPAPSKTTDKKMKAQDDWDSELEELEPEESDIESDSSEDDFVKAKPEPRAKSASKKNVSTTVDEPVSKKKRANQDMSDDDREGVAPAKSPDKKTKSAAKAKTKQQDAWDSELEELEPEESNIESDSSEDDFVTAKPAPKAKSAPKKNASTNVYVSKKKRANQDMSDGDNEGVDPAKSPDKKAKSAAKANKAQDAWGSELEESETEVESDSSDDDFVPAPKPVPKDRSAPRSRKVSTKFDKPTPKRKSDDDSDGDDPPKESVSKSKSAQKSKGESKKSLVKVKKSTSNPSDEDDVPPKKSSTKEKPVSKANAVAKKAPAKAKESRLKHGNVLKDSTNKAKKHSAKEKSASRAKSAPKGKAKVSLGISPKFSFKARKKSSSSGGTLDDWLAGSSDESPPNKAPSKKSECYGGLSKKSKAARKKTADDSGVRTQKSFGDSRQDSSSVSKRNPVLQDGSDFMHDDESAHHENFAYRGSTMKPIVVDDSSCCESDSDVEFS